MHAADGLIAILPPIDSDRDRIPAKVYEYLSTSRPILAVAHPAGALAGLLDGVPDTMVADNRDPAATAATLAAFVALARRCRAEGSPPEGRRRALGHGYRERAAELDSFLRTVLASG